MLRGAHLLLLFWLTLGVVGLAPLRGALAGSIDSIVVAASARNINEVAGNRSRQTSGRDPASLPPAWSRVYGPYGLASVQASEGGPRWRYNWRSDGQLASVELPGEGGAALGARRIYSYDALGRLDTTPG